MNAVNKEDLIRAFHMMWDNYPEMVRLIDRRFNVIAGNPAYYRMGGQDDVKCNTGDPSLHKGCQAMNALRSGQTKTLKSEVSGVTWDTFWIPVSGSDELYVHFTNGLNETISRMQGQTDNE